jgi:glycosyltransferase involved in cell wall biosynthesis
MALYTAHFPSFVTDWSWRNRIRNHVAEAVTCSLSTLTVTCAVSMEREFLKRGLVAPERICTIYNGVQRIAPSAPACQLRAGLGISSGAPVVLAIGRFTSQKGFDILLGAVPALVREIPDLRVLLAGDGEMRGMLEAQARELRIADTIQFMGFRQDVPDLLQLATVVVAPSRYEVFPLVPLEAMMAGKPVVASDLPVLREAIVDGRDGLLVPPTSEAVFQGLRAMLTDEQKRQTIGAQAAQRAAQEFGVARMAEGYANLYERLSAGRT